MNKKEHYAKQICLLVAVCCLYRQSVPAAGNMIAANLIGALVMILPAMLFCLKKNPMIPLQIMHGISIFCLSGGIQLALAVYLPTIFLPSWFVTAGVGSAFLYMALLRTDRKITTCGAFFLFSFAAGLLLSIDGFYLADYFGGHLLLASVFFALLEKGAGTKSGMTKENPMPVGILIAAGVFLLVEQLL